MNPEPETRASASAIIVAAGSSARMGFDKLFAKINGVPVLRHSVDAFQACPAIAEIVVVTTPGNLATIESWKTDCPKLARVVEGGAERPLSVANGLDALAPDCHLVAVHDGARPLVTPEAIGRCIAAAATHRAAACARHLTETVKRADAGGFASESLDRANLWVMETPQVFDVNLLRVAYRKIAADGIAVTDEVSALQHLGEKVLFVENSEPNIKITYPADLALAEAILRGR